MYRLAYIIYRLWTSIARWGVRRFTRAGYAALLGIFVVAIAGVDVDVSLTHQLFSLIFSVLLVSLLVSVWFRLRFSAERVLPRFGSVGLPLPYHIQVRNLSRKLQRGLILQENPADTRPNFPEFVAEMRARDRRTGTFRMTKARQKPPRDVAKTKPAEVPALPPGGEVEVSMELTPMRRGVVRFDGVSIGRPDPLGLFKSLVTRPLPGQVLVLPKRYFLPPIALPGFAKYQQGGVALASSIGQADEFIGLRDYRPGDPIRRIHWKSWAKAGVPVVKEYEDEYFVRHALILDTFIAEPDSLVFEEAVSVAASFACTIQTQESLLDLLFIGTEAYCFTAGRGLAQTEQLLEILAAVRVCATKPFKELSHLVLNHLSVVSGCIVILLTWDDARKELVQQMQALGVPLLLLVVADPASAKELEDKIKKDQVGVCHILTVGKVESGLAKL